MLSFIKCFERVLIKIISDLFPDIPPYPWGVSLSCSYFAIGMNEMNEMNEMKIFQDVTFLFVFTLTESFLTESFCVYPVFSQ